MHFSLAIGTGALFFAQGWVATSAAVTFVAIGLATVRPSLTSLVSQTAGPQRQGVALGAAQSLDSLAQIVTPITGGALISAFTPGTPGLVCAAIALAAMLYFVGARRSFARPVVAQPVPAE